jgi:fumarylpyruvate hydrolase
VVVTFHSRDKGVEKSSVVPPIVPMAGVVLDRGELALSVNGQLKQKSDLSKLIWSIPELADLSMYYHLQPGDRLPGRPCGGHRRDPVEHRPGQMRRAR